jgi:hypothetical protein
VVALIEELGVSGHAGVLLGRPSLAGLPGAGDAPRHRARAVALFDRLYAALAGPAQRHFDEVTTAP